MELVIRLSVVYVLLWLVLRGTGKRSLGDLSPLDLLVLVVIGDLVQQGVTQEDMSITGAAVVVATFALWTVVLDVAMHRRRRLAVVVDGSPVVVVRDGVVDERALASERLTIDDVREAAREHDIASLDEVQWCVLEPDGKLSFLTRTTERAPTDPA